MKFGQVILCCLLTSAMTFGPAVADSPTSPREAIGPMMQKLFQQALQQASRQPVKGYSRVPDGTYFQVPFKNETRKAVDLESLLPQSYILLDGKQYQWSGYKPTLRYIAAGEICSFDLSPDDYVPRVKRSLMADSLKRWRWASAIDPGDHKVVFFLGGKQYGPVSFSWNGTGPWNVPCE